MGALQESAGLFEVNMPDYKQLKTCRREVVMLKALWDMIALVKSSFSDWNTTLWCDINVEQMEMDCKKFVKVSSASCDSKDHPVHIDKYCSIYNVACLLECSST